MTEMLGKAYSFLPNYIESHLNKRVIKTRMLLSKLADFGDATSARESFEMPLFQFRTVCVCVYVCVCLCECVCYTEWENDIVCVREIEIESEFALRRCQIGILLLKKFYRWIWSGWGNFWILKKLFMNFVWKI